MDGLSNENTKQLLRSISLWYFPFPDVAAVLPPVMQFMIQYSRWLKYHLATFCIAGEGSGHSYALFSSHGRNHKPRSLLALSCAIFGEGNVTLLLSSFSSFFLLLLLLPPSVSFCLLLPLPASSSFFLLLLSPYSSFFPTPPTLAWLLPVIVDISSHILDLIYKFKYSQTLI